MISHRRPRCSYAGVCTGRNYLNKQLIGKDSSVSNSLYSEIIKNGLTFHSQPIVRLDDKKVVGHELLARLVVGDKFVSPHLFIPDIEREGLYSMLDERLSEYVLKYIANTDEKLFVSINVPSIESLNFHISNPQLISSANRIHFELLETVEWSHPANLEVVDRASSLGFSVFLDDFGSGFSNFKTLLNDSVKGVKIDREMLLQFMNKAKFEPLERMVDMVFSLKKQIVFEGIESGEHEAFIKRLNKEALCQGFLYGRPDLLGYD